MPVIIQSKHRYFGTVVTIPNAEVTVVEIGPQPDDYIVEGYLDLSSLSLGDSVEVREYIVVDGVNYGLFARAPYYGPLVEPVVRLHAKTLLQDMKYKVTILQASGQSRAVPYGFIVELMGTV